MMRFLDRTLATLPANLALDEALLLQAESGAGGEALRIWEWPDYAVVLGSGCKLAEEVNETACIADGVPILRRASGGGTVLVGPGCLLYALVLSLEREPGLADVRSSYRCIFGRMAAALGAARQEGTSDLALAGRKFSGNAQQRKRSHLLHHGTLLYAFDLARVTRYLRPPPREPDYRGGRSHGDFLCNLPLSAAEITRRLVEAWEAAPGEPEIPAEALARLIAEKYGADDWTRRR